MIFSRNPSWLLNLLLHSLYHVHHLFRLDPLADPWTGLPSPLQWTQADAAHDTLIIQRSAVHDWQYHMNLSRDPLWFFNVTFADSANACGNRDSPTKIIQSHTQSREGHMSHADQTRVMPRSLSNSTCVHLDLHPSQCSMLTICVRTDPQPNKRAGEQHTHQVNNLADALMQS